MILTCNKCTHSIPENAIYVSDAPGGPPICLNCIPEEDRNGILEQYRQAKGAICGVCHQPPKSHFIEKDNLTRCFECIPDNEKAACFLEALVCSCCTEGSTLQ